jgi:hypothetical protein
MTKVFPAWRLEEKQRGYDPTIGQMTDWKRTGSFFEVEEATHEYIREKTGRDPFFLMNLTKDPEAWAAVYFTSIIKKSDEGLKVRDDLGVEISFAAYGKVERAMTNPPLGAMVVLRPEDLAAASLRHEVFRKAWEALKSCARDKHWVAVVDL